MNQERIKKARMEIWFEWTTIFLEAVNLIRPARHKEEENQEHTNRFAIILAITFDNGRKDGNIRQADATEERRRHHHRIW